ncbi:MAG: DUF4157 domain-containing protein [Caldilineaceae bacterium]
MEPRLGWTSAACVHTDGQAAASAQAMNAQAFTVGDDIVFDEGRYAPQTPAGQELLAHELTHVAQQEGAAPDVTPAAADESRATPAIAFEQIDLPDPAGRDAAVADVGAASPVQRRCARKCARNERLRPPHRPRSPRRNRRRRRTGPWPRNPWTPRRPRPRWSRPAIRRSRRPRRSPVRSSCRHTSRWPRRSCAAKRCRRSASLGTKATSLRASTSSSSWVWTGTPSASLYREAAKYFKAKFPDATLVNDAAHRSLESVFTYIRGRAERVANLYIVSHANEDGTLSFKLRDGDRNNDPHVQYGDLVRALRDEATRSICPRASSTSATKVYIKGCNIGRSSRMLDELDKAFGGAGKVIAPTHKQVFGSKTEGKGAGRHVEHYEALSTYFIEYKGNRKIAPPTSRPRSSRSTRNCRRPAGRNLCPTRKRAARPRQLVAIPFTYDFGVNVKNAASKRTAQEQALAEAVAWGQENIARTDIFEWRIQSTKPSANGWLVTAVAEKTNYIVDKILVLRASGWRRPKRTRSTSAPPPTATMPKRRAARAMRPRCSSRNWPRLQPWPSCPRATNGTNVARRREIEATLGAHTAHVDVHVVKTEDWLGADEVHVKAAVRATVPR